MASFPECDQAIDDIINEAVVVNREESPISISLEKSNLSEDIKEKIHIEFKEIVRLLDFRKIGYELLKKWYDLDHPRHWEKEPPNWQDTAPSENEPND